MLSTFSGKMSTFSGKCQPFQENDCQPFQEKGKKLSTKIRKRHGAVSRVSSVTSVIKVFEVKMLKVNNNIYIIILLCGNLGIPIP